MRNFVALSQEIVRKLSQREQIVFIDFMSRAFVAAQRNGVDYLRSIEFAIEAPDVDADGVSDSRVRRTAAELLNMLPSPREVSEAIDARMQAPSTAEIAAGLKEGVIGSTPDSQPVHVHNEVSGIKPLDDTALADAADRALAKVQASVARDAEILPAIGEVKAADDAAGFVPPTADAPVPSAEVQKEITDSNGQVGILTLGEVETTTLTPESAAALVQDIKETHGEKAADSVAEAILGAVIEKEEPAPVGANSNPVPVVTDTTTSAAKPAAAKPAAKTASKKK